MSKGVPRPAGRKTLPNVLEELPEDAFRPEDRARLRPGSRRDDALRRLEAWTRQEAVVLLVGEADSCRLLRPALELRDLRVQVASAGDALRRSQDLVPDLVVLDESVDAVTFLNDLRQEARDSCLVVVLADESSLTDRLRAFRHGAAQVVSLHEDMGQVAAAIEKLARGAVGLESGAVGGSAGEATLDELVETLENELRSGILSVWPSGSEESSVTRLVLGGGKPLSDAIDAFVRAVRENVVSAEDLRFEFEPCDGGDIIEAGEAPAGASDDHREDPELLGTRVLLVDDDPARADALATAIRERGADVFVTGSALPDARFEKLRQVDPAVVLVARADAERAAFDLIRKIRRDVRMRWASLVLADWKRVYSVSGDVDILALAGELLRAGEKERALTDALENRAAFTSRVEFMGPARLLRVLATTSHALSVTVRSRRVDIELELTPEGLVRAQAQLSTGEKLEAAAAIATMLAIATGAVAVEPLEHPSGAAASKVLEVMGRAQKEPARLMPSVYAPPVGERLRRAAPSKVSTQRAFAGRGSEEELSVDDHWERPPIALTEDDVLDLVETLDDSATVDVGVDGKAGGPSYDEKPQASKPPPKPVSHRAPAPSIPDRDAVVPPESRTAREASAPTKRPLESPQPPPSSDAPAPSARGQVGASPPSREPSSRKQHAPPPSSRGRAPSEHEAPEGAGGHAWVWLLAALVLGGVLVFAFRKQTGDAAGTRTPASAPTPSLTAPTKTEEPSAAPSASAAPRPTELPDLPTAKVSSCEELLKGVPPPEGVYPGAALAKVAQAKEALRRKSGEEARALFCHALRFDPQSDTASLGLSQMLLERRAAKQALRWGKEAAKLGGDEARLVVADATALTGDYATARQLLSALPAEQRDVRGILDQGRSALESGDARSAERLYLRAALLAPEDPAAARGVAEALAAQGLDKVKDWQVHADALQKSP